jgi:ribonuclease HII
MQVQAVVRADAKFPAVSAASIIAKVARDKLMSELDKQYPEYKWAKNNGYGTADHLLAIRESGKCKMHRMSFNLKTI